MHSVQFHDADKQLSETLSEISKSLPNNHTTLRELLARIGEQGLLLCCLFLTLPFLLPISIPGVSTVFGIVIILIGIGVTLNRVPWLPHRIMEHKLPTEHLSHALERGARLVSGLERFVRPRLYRLTHGRIVNRVNGASVVIGGLLLLFPLGLVPFSNTLPAAAVLLLALGILQRDGLFIIAGHLMNLLTTLYFGALALAAMLAGHGLMALFGA
jgi:hypothetical protein